MKREGEIAREESRKEIKEGRKEWKERKKLISELMFCCDK